MGNNAAMTVFEGTVLGVYDAGALTKELLATLMELHRDTDIDWGGYEGTLSRDGKTIRQIMVETWGLEMPPKPAPDATDDEVDNYHEVFHDLVRSITDQFGWW